MRLQRWQMTFAAIALAVACVYSQGIEPLTPGKQVHAQAMLDTVFDFTLYAPPTYNDDVTKRWPLIIQFPPVGATRPQAIGYGPGFGQLVTVAICKRLQTPSTCKNVSDRFIVVSPYLDEATFPSQAYRVKDWIKYLFKTYRIDSTCVSYYGTCWGGNFGYSFSTAYPELPSAAVLFDINGHNSPGGSLDLTVACTIKNVAIKAYSASGDVYAPWQNADLAVKAINACSGGGNAEFILLNTSVHEIYNYVDTTTALYDWMLAQKRELTIANLSASPASVSDNATTPVTFSAVVTATGTVSNVSIDLSAIGGGSAVSMTKGSGGSWSVVFAVPQGRTPGGYYLSIKAVDSNGKDESASLRFDVLDHDAPVLVSTGKNAVASSTQDAGSPPTTTTDGNLTTRWSSAFSDPQWIYVDLGSTMPVSRVVLKWESAYGKAYTIQVSSNATTWTDVYSTTTGDGGIDTVSFTTTSARYVRMYGTQRATGYGYSLFEFEVFARLGSTIGEPRVALKANTNEPAIVRSTDRLMVNVRGSLSWNLEILSLNGTILHRYSGSGCKVIPLTDKMGAEGIVVTRLRVGSDNHSNEQLLMRK